jgi:hypothetical protein
MQIEQIMFKAFQREGMAQVEKAGSVNSQLSAHLHKGETDFMCFYMRHACSLQIFGLGF